MIEFIEHKYLLYTTFLEITNKNLSKQKRPNLTIGFDVQKDTEMIKDFL